MHLAQKRAAARSPRGDWSPFEAIFTFWTQKNGAKKSSAPFLGRRKKTAVS
jgi:hypothetical protein